jgi:hypothetical protein
VAQMWHERKIKLLYYYIYQLDSVGHH